MEDKGISQKNEDIKICNDLVIEPPNLVITNAEGVSQMQEVENNSDIYPNLETGNEVIAIVGEGNEEEIYLYEKNANELNNIQNPSEYIQICDSSNALEEVSDSQNKDELIIDVIGEEENDRENSNCKELLEESLNQKENIVSTKNCNIVKEKGSEGGHLKNFKSVILEDWEVEGPQVFENHESDNFTKIEALDESYISESEKNKLHKNENENGNVEINKLANEKNKIIENLTNQNSLGEVNLSCENEVVNMVLDKKVDSLNVPKSISKDEIVKILDESTERVVKPIIARKDLFFSIELTKRLNQQFSLNKSVNNSKSVDENDTDPCNNNNDSDDRQKIVEILEADEIQDWKSAPAKSNDSAKENGNDMEISKAIQNVEHVNSKEKPSQKFLKKTPKKFSMDKELERKIALQQLRQEFPSTRRRVRASRKVRHIPFLASTVLEKALTSPEVTTALKPGPPKRRPCYLPENASQGMSQNNEGNKTQGRVRKAKMKNDRGPLADANADTKSDFVESSPESSGKTLTNSVVKTYSVKRKSTDTENELKSTIAAVKKALNESVEEATESKPKKQKTATPQNQKKNKVLVKEKKQKSLTASDKKRNLELEKLLGDEGAVRMLYDTQHGDTGTTTTKKSKFKTTTGLKKDLVLKTKLVKNAVMRLSGVGAEGVSLRGKRRLSKPKSEISKVEEPLFSTTPNVFLYKPKKKQRAEASRILYRHSSSESFDSSEGYRRTSFDADGINTFEKSDPLLNGDKFELSNPALAETEKPKSKKSEILSKNKLKKIQTGKSLAQKRVMSWKKKLMAERSTVNPLSGKGSKLDLSQVPIRKSSRPRTVSRKYSIWSSTSMDSLSVESLGLKKHKKASAELGKKLNVKELTILQYEHLVQVVLAPISTFLKNSFHSKVFEEFIQVLRYLEKDGSCKAVLLSSQGSTFCQGVDINQIISFGGSERKSGVSQLVKKIKEFIMCLAEFKKPIIVGVHAAAVGLGVTLLPYCDLVVSSDKASFYTPYVKIGQAPEGGPTHTFLRINRHLVSELLYKSNKITAADALKYGLVTEVIPEDRFEEDLIMIARNLASRPPQGTQSIRFLLGSTEVDKIEEILQLEGELLEEQWTSPECLSNMVKFLNSGELQIKPIENT